MVLGIVYLANMYVNGLKRFSRTRVLPTLLMRTQFKPLLKNLSRNTGRSNIFKQISPRPMISGLSCYSQQRRKFQIQDSLLWLSTALVNYINAKDSYGLFLLAKASPGLLHKLLLLVLCVKCSLRCIWCLTMDTY